MENTTPNIKCTGCEKEIPTGKYYHAPLDKKMINSGTWCKRCWNKLVHPSLEKVHLDYWRVFMVGGMEHIKGIDDLPAY